MTSSDAAGAAEKRARWRAYFAQHLGGSEAEIDVATAGGMRALERGADASAIVAAGEAALTAYRRGGQAAADRQPVPQPEVRRAPAVLGSPTSGMVAGLQQRQEAGGGRRYMTVWTFRLEHTDAAGSPLTPISVEMRGYKFSGAIHPGDMVDVQRPPKPGRPVETQRVRNLTTGLEVRARGRRHPVFQAIGVAFVIAFFAVVVVSILRGVLS